MVSSMSSVWRDTISTREKSLARRTVQHVAGLPGEAVSDVGGPTRTVNHVAGTNAQECQACRRSEVSGMSPVRTAQPLPTRAFGMRRTLPALDAAGIAAGREYRRSTAPVRRPDSARKRAASVDSLPVRA